MMPMFEAAERAVLHARRLGLDEDDARKLIRGEISRDTLNEIVAAHGRDLGFFDFDSFMKRTAPLVYRGISFYLIDALPVPWRVIGLGEATTKRLGTKIVEG